jgi:GWxTD domain-containing protein
MKSERENHRMSSISRGESSTVLAALAVAAVLGFLGSSLHVFANPDTQNREETSFPKAIQKETESPYKKWVQEEVPYIITHEERQAFKRLTTDDERERFIENFWERRNPNPGSRENEFKEEYYRRIAYANGHFASPGITEVGPAGPAASGIPGWKTDRGRIYIMYGPPNEVDSHSGDGETASFEDWTYNYIDGIGNNLKLEFVDPTLRGEYHLTMDPGEKDKLLHVPPDDRQVP